MRRFFLFLLILMWGFAIFLVLNKMSEDGIKSLGRIGLILIGGSVLFFLVIFLTRIFKKSASKKTELTEGGADGKKPEKSPEGIKKPRWLTSFLGGLLVIIAIAFIFVMIGKMIKKDKITSGTTTQTIHQTEKWEAGWSKKNGVIGASSQKYGGPFDVEMIRHDNQGISFYILVRGKRDSKISLIPNPAGGWSFTGVYQDFRFGTQAPCRFNIVDDNLIGEVSAEDGSGWINYSIRKL